MTEQQQTREDLEWKGQPARHIPNLTLATVLSDLPEFEREDFGENEYLDVIRRLPFKGDRRTIPVGSVSKRYFLVQHFEVVQRVAAGLKGLGFTEENVPVELWISEYGERMRLRCQCLQRPLDPGDGFPLVLTADCSNSVDKSCALEIQMSWVRLVCMNGWTTKESARLRKVHDAVWMNRQDLGEFVKEQVGCADVHFQAIREWMERRTDLDRIAKWVDNIVADQWNKETAARVYHICCTGFDGIAASVKAGTPAHQMPVSSDKRVPGACAPVRTAYHAAQALSWVASRRPTVDDQVAWVRKIHELIDKLAVG